MDNKIILVLFSIILLTSFVLSTECDCDDIDERLSNIEEMMDGIRDDYNILPTIAQGVSRLEMNFDNLEEGNDGLKVYLIPGSIVFCSIIILVIILVRRKNG